MDNTPLVSIIIVNFNGRRYLKNCFDSLLNGAYKNIEIIFVDNGSDDGSLGFVRENYPGIIIVDNKANLGLAAASNRAADFAKGKYLFFYNNDTIADRLLIANLVRRMEKDPLIGICGCRTYTYDGKAVINQGVACDIFGYPYANREPFYVDASIFIKRDIFFRIGRFDEEMFLYGEDRDICWRCWLYGYKVAVAPDAVFYHDSYCITQDIKQYRSNINKRFWGEFNALRAILKNYSLCSLLFILPAFMAINAAEITLFLIKGKTDVVKNAYLRAYAQNLRSIKDTLEKRRQVQKKRRISDFELIRHMSKVSGKLRLLLAMGVPEFSERSGYGKA